MPAVALAGGEVVSHLAQIALPPASSRRRFNHACCVKPLLPAVVRLLPVKDEERRSLLGRHLCCLEESIGEITEEIEKNQGEQSRREEEQKN